MDIEITGSETPEQLEALLEQVGDVEISDEEDGALVAEGDTAGDTTQAAEPAAGDNLTPDSVAGGNPAAPPVREILARDGRQIIPYDIACPSVAQADGPECVTICMKKRNILLSCCP